MSTYLFIDGTNLYAAQYELFGPKKFLDFSKFIRLIEKNLNIIFARIYFYASYSPQPKNSTRKQKFFLKNEALFFRSVKKTKNVIFFTGYRSKTSGKEKEVDVKLTADIISFAFLNKYRTVYLLTGDADFLQALLTIQKFHNKKKIHLLCIENKVMYQGLFYFKTHIIIFRKKFVSKRKFKNLSQILIDEKNNTKNI